MPPDEAVDAPDLSATTGTAAEAGGEATPLTAPPASDTAVTEKTPDFYEAELRRARDEAAESRVSAKRYKDAFDGYDEAQVDNYLQMVKLLGSDNPEDLKEAKRRFSAVVAFLDENGLAPEESDQPQYLTKDDLEKLQFEQEVQRNAVALVATAERLGYKEGSTQYRHLLNVAMEDPQKPLTLEQAHEKILADIDAIQKGAVQAYIDGLSGQDKHPPVSVGGAGAVTTEPTGPSDPRAAARARIAAAGLNKRS